jgi:hypothetical protein
MIHVPDVRATVAWYLSIGFALIRQNDEDGEINWAKMTFGNGEVMFQAGGKASAEFRREVDLYILTDSIDDLYQRLKDRVQLVEDPHDTFYCMVNSSCVIATDSGSRSGSRCKRSPGI